MLFSLLDLAFIVFSVIFYAVVYATLIMAILYRLSRVTQNEWLLVRMDHKFRYWLLLNGVFIAIFTLYINSYRRDTGTGEAPSLPVGYGQRVYNRDYAWTFIDTPRGDLFITSFAVQDTILCAKLSHQFSGSTPHDYAIMDLRTRNLLTFTTSDEYEAYASHHKVPAIRDFRSFEENRNTYLANRSFWEKWLLP